MTLTDQELANRIWPFLQARIQAMIPPTGIPGGLEELVTEAGYAEEASFLCVNLQGEYQASRRLVPGEGITPTDDGAGGHYHLNLDGNVYVPLDTALTSTSWDGDARSTTAKTLIDTSSVFGAPAGIRAAYVEVAIRDSGGDGVTTLVGMLLDPGNTAGVGQAFSCNGITNDAYARFHAIIPCNADGDFYYQITATGTDTCDVWLKIWGYFLGPISPTEV